PKIRDHEKFYFDDGTIILSVQGVHFRLHTGILAMHSPVFTDMTTLGSASYQGGAIGGNLDPCPIVEMQDSIHDWRHVLRVIYNIKPLTRCACSFSGSIGDETYRPTFDELSAYVRLGHKYQMDAFYEPAMDYLERFFSPTLDRWNKWSSRDELYTLPGCAPESAIGIVNLARLTGKESLVPLALLSCCQLGGKLLKGLARPDGTYETLSTEDFERCFNAMPRLTSHGIEWMQVLTSTRFEGPCPNISDPRHLTRDENFYYHDGTIILVVNSVEFRVHAGILCQNSPVFKDMLSLGVSSTASLDGSTNSEDASCPVVELHDSARDWRHVLSVLYDSSPLNRSHQNRGEKDWHRNFNAVSAYVRLGHKYQMSGFYDPAMEYLETWYNPRFAHWKAVNCIFLNVPRGWDETCAIGVVNIARLTGKASILPYALLSCCQIGSELLKGLRYDDGERETLSMEDLVICLAAGRRLVHRGAEVLLSLIYDQPDEPCQRGQAETEGDPCIRGLRSLLSDRIDDASFGDQDAPSPFVLLCLDSFCDVCSTVVEAQCDAFNLETLSKLPSFFKIGVTGG
ncbi:uncharacterized protein BXZ73DRAFT_49920, partial [Epithele typhae]|uniref:uncharacterized protein n=1 Tax=Epithele typhae TaxID=378194 RepID=UPI00200881F5